MRDLVLAYYFKLRTLLRSQPDLRRCLTRCRHCRIFFIAHPSVRWRNDLGCPFGCREAHERKSSAMRSTAYYQTEAGKKKKARLNARRRKAGDSGSKAEGASAEIEADEIQLDGTGRQAGDPENEPEVESTGPRPDEIEFDAGIVDHVRMVTSLIEGFAVSREAVVAMLERIVRQRHFARESRQDYVVRWLTEHSP